jgi:hypothetical protein
MRHLGLLLIGSLALSACASNSTTPAASSSTVARATDEPNRGPDFAPAASDGLATAEAEPRQSAHPTQPAPTLGVPRDEAGARVDPTSANAAAAPSDRSSAPAPAPAPATDADNSRVNTRDRSSSALTPMDQGGSEADRKLTQQIRQDLMKDKSLSFTAKNVKIITVNGKVTLRGPVKSEAERSAIEAAARRATGSGASVDSQLEISK